MVAQVINALIDRVNADPAQVEDVFMGCVSQIGEQSTNVARNAVLASKLPESVPGTSIDRQCGSSQQAVHFGAQAVMSGVMDMVIAAGVESMSRVPMFTPSSLPQKHGMGTYISSTISTRYNGATFSQFAGAELLAKKHGITK
jgi:acetyl-CoA C-acetyltransferase